MAIPYGNKIDVRFNDPVLTNSDGDAYDPTTVEIIVAQPDGTETTYVYDTDDEVVKNGTGDYSWVGVPNAGSISTTRGVWIFRLQADDEVASNDVYVRILGTRLDSAVI